jgi:GNAT superfamily N-acetyltransferase
VTGTASDALVAEARLLDEVAANAMPPTTSRLLDGWVLRHTPDVPMRRANSVLTLTAGDGLALDARLAIVEDHYRRVGRPVRLQVGDASAPADLDDALAARGYEIEAPVDVCTAPTTTVLARCARDAAAPVLPALERQPVPDERWLATWRDCDTSDRPVELYGEAFRDLLGRVGPDLLAVAVPGTGVAVGVRERGRVGVFSMKTHPDQRRHGVGRALLHELARWADDGGATTMYLQVETDNHAARALYDGAGFTRHHGYRYRTVR